jgi:hypothetical protein
MAEKRQTKRFKLGPNTTIFWDSSVSLKVLKGQVVEYSGIITQKIKVGLSNRHIIETDESATEKTKAEAPVDEGTELTDFSDKAEFPNKESLVEYYEDNFDPEEEELDAFSNLGRAAMEEELNRLEAEGGK